MGQEYRLTISFDSISGATADAIVEEILQLKTSFGLQDIMISFAPPFSDEEFDSEVVFDAQD